MKYFPFVLLFFSVIAGQQQDSIKTYNLKEITVQSGVVLEPKSVTEINYKRILKSDASTVSEIGKFIPSLKVQTNSRGETLFYVRGSGERQISLFFDGVPLNIPWDNRIDLSLLPTEAVGRINVTKGIPSIVFGANTLAGVVNIFSKQYDYERQSRINLQVGENSHQKFSGYLIDGNDVISYMASLNYHKNNGYRLPSSYREPIESPGDFRINSFKESLSAFAKLNYTPSSLNNYSVSVSYLNSEKGVPPEMDVSKPRYWQYPVWEKFGVSFNGTHKFGANNNSFLTYIFSVSQFDMQIDQFKDISYTDIDDTEKNNDRTIFGKVTATHFMGSSHLLKFSISGYNTLHEESFLETDFNTINEYSQNVISGGVEYEYVDESITGIIGVGLDAVSTPKTGDKPSKDGGTDYSINSSLGYSLSRGLSAHINYGRKTRFPTLRESFSGALGKFVLNPDLKAEVANSFEAGVSYIHESLNADLNFFLTYTSDGIVKVVVPTDDGSSKFQRINKDEIRTYGVELISGYEFNDSFNAQLNFTMLNAFAKNSEGEFKDTLEYKPSVIGGLNLDYSPFENFNNVIELQYVGKEFGFQGGNTYIQQLPDYLLVHFRTSYSFKIRQKSKLELYIRINNIFDRLYYTQWSLPEAGRQVFAGLTFDF